jgi:hypothetical protein
VIILLGISVNHRDCILQSYNLLLSIITLYDQPHVVFLLSLLLFQSNDLLVHGIKFTYAIIY